MKVYPNVSTIGLKRENASSRILSIPNVHKTHSVYMVLSGCDVETRIRPAIYGEWFAQVISKVNTLLFNTMSHRIPPGTLGIC